MRKSAASLCFALSVVLLSPPVLHSAEEHSYAQTIQQYVGEDKVYLLENIRQNITRPSEKMVVDALLCESGPQAIELFKKQLRDYPDPLLDQLSTSRISAYRLALQSTASLPKLSRPLPPPKPGLAEIPDTTRQNTAPLPAPLPERSKKESAMSEKRGFTLQFGSFANKEAAEALADQISVYETTKTIRQGGLFKVRLKKAYATRKEAADVVKEMPFSAIVVDENEAPH